MSGSLTNAHFHPKANLISLFLRYTFYLYLSVPSRNQCASCFFGFQVCFLWKQWGRSQLEGLKVNLNYLLQCIASPSFPSSSPPPSLSFTHYNGRSITLNVLPSKHSETGNAICFTGILCSYGICSISKSRWKMAAFFCHSKATKGRLSSANLKQQWWMAIQISDFSAVQGKEHITHWDALLVTRPQNVERVLRAILTLSKALLIMKSDFMGEKWTFSFGILSLSHVCLCLSIFLSFNRHQQIMKINGSRYTHMINMPTAGDIQNTSALLADTGKSLQAF